MVAFAGSDPIGVLIGAKRPAGTLVYKIAVHPDHLKAGSWRSPARIAQLEAGDSRSAADRSPKSPRRSPSARALFSASGYVQEAMLTDYVLEGPALSERSALEGPALSERSAARGRERVCHPCHDRRSRGEWFLGEWITRRTCWERAVETLTARKDEIEDSPSPPTSGSRPTFFT